MKIRSTAARVITVARVIVQNAATAIVISVVALIWSMANTYFTFFWHPQDLRVYFRFPAPAAQVGTNTLNVNYIMSNMGNQAVLIEDVGIYELWINSEHSTIRGAELHFCEDTIVIRPESLAPGSRATLSTMKGVLVSLYQPVKTYIDGTEEKTSSISVEAGKMRVIATTFETDPVPRNDYNTAVICPVIRLFDSKGYPVLAVCEGWQSTRVPLGTITSSPPNRPAARLLPISSAGACRSIRVSSE
jgi:hypothetical protein